MCTLLRLPQLRQALRITSAKATATTTAAPSSVPQRFLATEVDSKPDLKATHALRFQDTDTTWRTIYRLPMIRLAAAFNRLKIYQAAVTIAGLPIVIALQQAGEVSAQGATIFTSLGITGFVTISLVSFAMKNLIGYIYINQTEDQLKFAFVDFWGRRQEVILLANDLLADTEQAYTILSSYYQSIHVQTDAKLKFKLLPRFGDITEPATFVTFFGE